ncbi:MAG: tetratricopeptide repeat protein [Phycisphaerales bacterium]|nr:tetratricopeptide repeat protein [Phycisphaerales bacterium]MCB9855014.1 tetratricopeptide repeat protein [Phycisphaerales bacterium]MCB9863469.1 tetratricopeptide repeat protein [Phycisphaerales bacterium]
MPARTFYSRCSMAMLLIVGLAAQAHGGGDDAASLATAHGFLKRGLYDIAEQEYRRVLADSPDETESQQAHYGLAVCLVRQSRFADASPLLSKLFDDESFAFAADVGVMLAQCRSALGDYDGAADVVARCRGRLAGHALADDAALIGIEALYRAGKHLDCLRNATAFLKAYADSNLAALVRAYGGLSAAQLGKDADAVELTKAALRDGLPDAMAERVRLTLADAMQRTGDLDGAAEAYEVVHKAGGTLASRAALGRGSAMWKKGDHSAAMALLDEALKAPEAIGAANVAYAQLIRGRVLLDDGRFADAESALEKSEIASAELSLPYLDQARYWRAKCLLRGDDAKKAVDLLRAAIEAHPKSELIAEMRYDLAVACVRMQRNEDAIDALNDFAKRHSDHPLMPGARVMLASAKHQTGDYRGSDEQIAAWRKESTSGTALPADLAFVHAENAYLTGDYAAAADRYAAFLKSSEADSRSAVARRRLGLSQYRNGDLDAAMKSLSALGEGGETSATVFAIGDIHFSNRDWQNARSWLDRFIAAPDGAPTDDALLKSGIAHQRVGDYETALRRFTSIIEQAEESPHRAQAVFETGQTFVAMDRLDDAAKAFRRVLKMKGAKRFANPAREHLASIGLRTGRPELAAETFAAMAGEDASDDERASVRLRQAEALIQAEKFDEAAEVLRELLASTPAFADREKAKANRVLALARASDCDGAIEQFDDVKLDALAASLSLAIRYDRAWCLRKLGKVARAASAFGEIVESSGDSALGRHAALELAVIESERGDRAASLRLLEGLATSWRDKQLPDGFAVDQVLYRLGKTRFEMDAMDASSAAMRDLIEAFPKSDLVGPAAYLAGEAAFRGEQYERVVTMMERAIELGPDADYHASALLRLGDALNRLQRWAESERRFGEFLAKHGDSENAYQANFGIGWARENDRRFSDAIESYRRVTDGHKGPTAARAQFQIGQCLFASKDYEGAVRELIKTDILYAYPEWSAAALFEAGRCFERMNRRGEARQQFKTVVEKYGKTKWAAPAGERLQALASAGMPG